MSSIVTITLNPAIDKSTAVAELLPDKKMKCDPPVFEPGGGGINVARAIKRLGGNAKAIYLGGGHTGKFFNQLLDKEEVDSSVIEIAAHTRENLIVLDKKNNKQYRFGMPGPSVKDEECQQILALLEDMNDVSFLVASGSIPPGIPADIYARIASITKRKKIKLVVDTSGEPLKLALNAGVFLIKPNLGELATLAEKERLTTDKAETTAKQILKEKKCEVIIISLGEAGAMLVSAKETMTVKAPVVERKSTVGAGDSMTAGIVYSLSKGWSLQQAVQYGVACGTAATMNAGTELCHKDDADRLYDLIKQEHSNLPYRF
jgi:6-phosphofructokinase 2